MERIVLYLLAYIGGTKQDKTILNIEKWNNYGYCNNVKANKRLKTQENSTLLFKIIKYKNKKSVLTFAFRNAYESLILFLNFI